MRSLQDAVDVVPDGGRIEIAEGTHRIDRPIFVTGKRVTIYGRNHRLTQLVGPAPRPVVDRGRVIVPLEDAQGMFNVTAGELDMRDLSMSGFDAAIVVMRSGQLDLKDVAVSDSGRGIISLSAGPVKMHKITVQNTLWTSIAIKGPPNLSDVEIKASFVGNSQGMGMYFENTYAIVDDDFVHDHAEGGIVLYKSGGLIVDSTVQNNTKFGILSVQSPGAPVIQNDIVSGTHTWGPGAEFGDGIVTVLSPVFITGTQSNVNDRAGVANFSGTVTILDSSLTCNKYDMGGHTLPGENPYVYLDGGGVGCGCPTPAGPCVVQPVTITPPSLDDP